MLKAIILAEIFICYHLITSVLSFMRKLNHFGTVGVNGSSFHEIEYEHINRDKTQIWS